MRPFGWMGTLVVIFAIGAVALCLLNDNVTGFPKEALWIFWPAQYVWIQLQHTVGKGAIGKVVSNVAVFGLLGGAEGGIVGVIVDLHPVLSG